MVKEEDHDDSGITSRVKVEDEPAIKIEATEESHSRLPYENKNHFPSSSSSQQRLNLIGMGFAPTLVDKAIMKHGEEDIDLLIETLCSQPTVQASNSELPDGRCFDDEDNASSFELSFSDTDEIEEKKPLAVDFDKKHSLLKMNFSVEDIDLALNGLGHNASLPELIDYIIAAQIAGVDQGKNVVTTETLFRTMDKSLRLLEMGFTEEEISTAIENFGSEASVDELADSIFAKRIANGCIKEEDDAWLKTDAHGLLDENESKCHVTAEKNKRIFSESDIWETKPSTVHDVPHDQKVFGEGKRPRWVPVKDKSCSSSVHRQETDMDEMKQPFFNSTNSFGMPEYEEEKMFNKVVSNKSFCSKNVNQHPSMAPYFFFGNVTDSSQETWNKLSRFLYGTEPEHVNTQFFSAFIRKEVYFHNLPTQNRCHIHPRPAMTIEEALPDTKRWWPSWDTRKQLGCITCDGSGAAQICERLGKMLVRSKGILTKEQQMDMLHHCRTLNLLWVGEHKLRPIDPDNVEYILGYPMEHTKIGGLLDADRMRALKYSFQIDTLGYHLSTLKQMYPDGLKLLTVFSGIGGAEMALARLGIHLKCAVSVDSSEINRKILKRWWQNTGQMGELRQIDGIEKLNGSRIESLIKEFGGFDIIFCGNPHHYRYGVPCVDGSEGVDFTLFHEFIRVFQRVKGIMARR